MPGIELKSVEFFVFTPICQQLSPLLSVKQLKRLMHLLGSGVRWNQLSRLMYVDNQLMGSAEM